MKFNLNNKNFLGYLEFNLRHHISDELNIQGFAPVYGGDINESFKLITNKGNFFIKLNDNSLFPGMFEKEAAGLKLLKETNTLYIPEVIMNGQLEDTSYLVMEFIENDGNKKATFWMDFGRKLAEMHRHTNRFFGLDYDNYIGSLLQINTPDTSWTNFFIENRLKYQLKIALNKGHFTPKDIEEFEKLFELLPHILPDELPNLIHGDLWSGNFICSKKFGAVLIDPAVYYGNREMDLAMTQLFGGFDDEFYLAYHDNFPLKNGWQQRIKIYQLYPLLVHVNLFGGSYIHSVMNNLRIVLDSYAYM